MESDFWANLKSAFASGHPSYYYELREAVVFSSYGPQDGWVELKCRLCRSNIAFVKGNDKGGMGDRIPICSSCAELIRRGEAHRIRPKT